MSYPIGQYFDPTIPQVYQTYQIIRRLHPNKSMPKNQDLPELNLYLVYSPPPAPEVAEGMYAQLKLFPELNPETSKYEQAWEILPIPVTP